MQEKSDINYISIGEQLRTAREQFALAVQDVAHQLHIRPRYVEALERGDIDALPSPLYARGYLQHYARFLGLDSAEMSRQFEAVGLAPERKSFQLPPMPHAKDTPSQSVIIGGVVIALLCAVYMYMSPDFSGNSAGNARVEITTTSASIPYYLNGGIHPCVYPWSGSWPPCYGLNNTDYRPFWPETPLVSRMQVVYHYGR